MGGTGPRAGAPPATGAADGNAGRPAGPPRTPFIWTLAETADLANDCGPNIGAVLDAWHWHHSGSTVNDILAAGKSRIIHVHVSDAKPAPPEEVRDNQRWMPGEGVIDLVGFFRALQTIGYDDGVSPEPLGRVPAEMSADDAARLGLDSTTAVMKKAGVI
jgi:sugar phosphate isomerase/epimerase